MPSCVSGVFRDALNVENVLKEVLVQLEVMINSTDAKIEVNTLPLVLGNQTFLQQL